MSLFDLGFVIDALSGDTVAVTRSLAGMNVNGVMVVDTDAPFNLLCNVQAYAGRDRAGRQVDRNDDGQQLSGQICIFSKTELLPAKSPDGRSDEVSWKGDAYTVIKSEQWDSYGYFRSVLVKKEV